MNNTTKSYKYHYVYRITNLFPVGAERFYIGVRSCNVIPAKDNYWGSSVSLTEAIKQQGQMDFAKEILSTWKTREEADKEEERLHDEINVRDNSEYYNKHNANSQFNLSSEHHSSLTTKQWKNPKMRKKMSDSIKASASTFEGRQKRSEWMKAYCSLPETKQRKSNEVTARWASEEFRDKIAVIYETQEYKEKMSQAKLAAWNNVERKQQLSERLSEYWKDNEYREKMSTMSKETWKNQERKEQQSNMLKNSWQDPEYREKMTVLASKKYVLISPTGEEHNFVGFEDVKSFVKVIGFSVTSAERLFRNNGKPSTLIEAGWSGFSFR